MDDYTKEVYFDKYCSKCKYEKNSESDDPCWDCLNTPVNINSHKPIMYQERTK